MKFLALFFLPVIIFAQTNSEQEIETAYQNAKKGIYWALSNIPDRKNSISNDLISEDQLIAEVKLSKEIKGVKVESVGHCNTQTVEITAYKSYDTLIREGYIKD